MIRSVSQVALALTVIILLLPMLALAQPSDHQKLRDAAIKSWRGASAPAEPASAASAPAYTKADITRDTPCGAPGVGEVWGGERRGQIEYRDGVPGVRVNSAGMWSKGCKMPPPPKDCPERKAPAWVIDGRFCQPVHGRMIPGRNAPFGHDVRSDPTLRNVGIQRWRCEKIDGVAEWRSVGATCKGR